MPKGYHTIDISGQRFGRLVAIQLVQGSSRRRHWECSCDCGGTAIVVQDNLRSGQTKSCGCLRNEKASERMKAHATHGMSKTKTYLAWMSMKQRCLNSNHRFYAYYGGRGITICERWMTFENFYTDMGEKPKGMTLDRINNMGNYEPSNCRWATWSEQANNKRNNVFVSFNGKTQTIAAWSIELNLSHATLWHRYRRFESFDLSVKT